MMIFDRFLWCMDKMRGAGLVISKMQGFFCRVTPHFTNRTKNKICATFLFHFSDNSTIKIHFIYCLRHSWLKKKDLSYRTFGDQPLSGHITYQNDFYGLIVMRKYDL